MSFQFFKQSDNKENVIITLRNLVSLLDIRVSKESIYRTRLHKDYPSLSAIEDCLQEWNVQTLGIRIDKAQLSTIPIPAIVHMAEGGETYFAVLKKVDNEFIEYVHPVYGLVTSNLHDFESNWSGFALLVEKNEKSGENGYFLKKKRELIQKLQIVGIYSTLTLLISLIILYGAMQKFDFFSLWVSLFIIYSVGIVLCIFLFAKKQGTGNPLIGKLCDWGNLSRNIGCSNVLNSKASNLFGIINLIDIGLVYFTGKLLAIVLFLFTDGLAFLYFSLWSICIPTLPFTIFSLYYQFFILKRICPLCIGVLFSIWLEFTLLSSSSVLLLTPLRFNWESVILQLVSFSIPILFLLIVKNMFVSKKEMIHLESDLLNFKRSPRVMEAALREGKNSMIDLAAGREIILGNVNGKISIIAVLNPYCESCKKAFSDLRKLVNEFDCIKVIIRLNVSNPALSYFATLVISSYLSGGSLRVIKTLDDWFELNHKNLREWNVVDIHEIDSNKEQINEILFRWQSWEIQFGLTLIPIFFIDGYQISNHLSLNDFKPYFKAKIT